MRHASGVAPVTRRRVTRCSEATSPRACSSALASEAMRSRQSSIPVASTATLSKLRDAGNALLDPDRAIVADRDQRHGFGASLVDIPTLRHPGHHDRAIALDDRALVDMAKCPIAKAGASQISKAAWRIEIMARCAGETGVHQADVHGTLDRRPVLAEQAFGSMGLGEAEAMDRDGKLAAAPLDRNRLGAAAEQLHGIR